MMLTILSVVLMGFGSGFTLLFSSQVLVTWMLDMGGTIDQIGLISFLSFPYLCSFLWMPLMDYLARFWRRQYMVGCGFMLMSLLLYKSSLLHPVYHYYAVLGLGFIMALIGATQDHVIEAYRLKALPVSEYKLGVSLSLVAFRVGIMLAGGLGLIFAAIYGWQLAYQTSALLLCVLSILVIFSPNEKDLRVYHGTLKAHLRSSKSFLNALFKDYRFMSFLTTYRLSIFWLELMMPALLMRFLGMDVFQVGVVYKVYGMLGLVLGGIVVNILVPQKHSLQALFWCLVLQWGICLSFFSMTMVTSVSYLWVSLMVFFECFLQGMLGTVSTVWLMGKTRPSMPAFNFSIWYGLSAIGRVWIGPIAAGTIDHYGWGAYTLTGVFLAMLSLWVCHWYSNQA